ncbi:MAG TPA: DUF1697 domain-containing protein, partial [Actinomycetota bacterium]|nr:DUF1697 domain-containing protein [Actinomycetota bacterium]
DMVHVALLRGINVGGKNKVGMKELKDVFEKAGLDSVTTYINSGNVIFRSPIRSRSRLADLIEPAVEERFGFDIAVTVRDLGNMRKVVKAIPGKWTNDGTMKCDVMFLWDDVDRPSVVKKLPIKPDLEDVRYVPGALIWRVDRKNITRSGMMRMAGTPLYKRMTIRNVNTTRKLAELMEATRASS